MDSLERPGRRQSAVAGASVYGRERVGRDRTARSSATTGGEHSRPAECGQVLPAERLGVGVLTVGFVKGGGALTNGRDGFLRACGRGGASAG